MLRRVGAAVAVGRPRCGARRGPARRRCTPARSLTIVSLAPQPARVTTSGTGRVGGTATPPGSRPRDGPPAGRPGPASGLIRSSRRPAGSARPRAGDPGLDAVRRAHPERVGAPRPRRVPGARLGRAARRSPAPATGPPPVRGRPGPHLHRAGQRRAGSVQVAPSRLNSSVVRGATTRPESGVAREKPPATAVAGASSMVCKVGSAAVTSARSSAGPACPPKLTTTATPLKATAVPRAELISPVHSLHAFPPAKDFGPAQMRMKRTRSSRLAQGFPGTPSRTWRSINEPGRDADERT